MKLKDHESREQDEAGDGMGEDAEDREALAVVEADGEGATDDDAACGITGISAIASRVASGSSAPRLAERCVMGNSFVKVRRYGVAPERPLVVYRPRRWVNTMTMPRAGEIERKNAERAMDIEVRERDLAVFGLLHAAPVW